jgi:hypothetical protein
MMITLMAPSAQPFTPDCPWLPRGQHPVLVPDTNYVVQVDTSKIPLSQLFAAGFSLYGGLVYAPGA